MTYAAFTAAHAPTLRVLLPASLHHLVPFKVEQFGPLTKYTLGPLPDGRWAMLHHLTQADEGPPHDHPCAFESTVIVGGYWERVYQLDGTTQDVRREPGGCHLIAATCIHRITSLPTRDCWTLVKAGPVVQQCRHYPELL